MLMAEERKFKELFDKLHGGKCDVSNSHVVGKCDRCDVPVGGKCDRSNSCWKGGGNLTDTSHTLDRGNMIDVIYPLGEKCDRCKLPTE